MWPALRRGQKFLSKFFFMKTVLFVYFTVFNTRTRIVHPFIKANKQVSDSFTNSDKNAAQIKIDSKMNSGVWPIACCDLKN